MFAKLSQAVQSGSIDEAVQAVKDSVPIPDNLKSAMDQLQDIITNLTGGKSGGGGETGDTREGTGQDINGIAQKILGAFSQADSAPEGGAKSMVMNLVQQATTALQTMAGPDALAKFPQLEQLVNKLGQGASATASS